MYFKNECKNWFSESLGGAFKKIAALSTDSAGASKELGHIFEVSTPHVMSGKAPFSSVNKWWNAGNKILNDNPLKFQGIWKNLTDVYHHNPLKDFRFINYDLANSITSALGMGEFFTPQSEINKKVFSYGNNNPIMKSINSSSYDRYLSRIRLGFNGL